MYHKTVDEIKALLDKEGIVYETFEHEPVRTSDEAAKVRHGYLLHQGAKAIIIRVKVPNIGKKFVMLVVPGDKRFDTEKVKALNMKEVRFATEEEVSGITHGVLPGGVPPFGNLFGLEVYADKGVLENERIIFNAGDRSFSIGMTSKDYADIVKPTIVEIV